MMRPHSSKTRLMGILNTTPDSFYDKGRFFDLEGAVARGIEIAHQGADIIDIGGESSRPGAQKVSLEEELKRTIPVIERLSKTVSASLSIDTTKPEVAEAAIRVGANFINDVSGFEDPKMVDIAASHDVDICVMHRQGTSETMQLAPHYPEGVVAHLLVWFEKRVELLVKRGIREDKIILDPGIGFGKTVADNLKIIHNLAKFKALGFRLLLGVSRKSFMTKVINKPAADLLPTTLAINVVAIEQKVDIIRVHDIGEHRDVIDLLTEKNNII